jgi:hypothetical protein
MFERQDDRSIAILGDAIFHGFAMQISGKVLIRGRGLFYWGQAL